MKCLIEFVLQAVKYIEFDHTFSDDEKRHANTLRLSCNLNNAACKLKLEEYTEAAKLCTKVYSLILMHLILSFLMVKILDLFLVSKDFYWKNLSFYVLLFSFHINSHSRLCVEVAQTSQIDQSQINYDKINKDFFNYSLTVTNFL